MNYKLRALRGDKLFDHEGHEAHEGRIYSLRSWPLGAMTQKLRDLRALRVDKLFDHEGREAHEGRGVKGEGISRKDAKGAKGESTPQATTKA